jgi:hypothetical protein
LFPVLLVLAILIPIQAAFGGPICTSGTLAGYEALGAGGCSIGAVTVASFGAVSGSAGATAIDPTVVAITPGGGTTNPELTFSVDLTATTPSLLEAIFTYAISGPAFTMDTITLSNSSETADGAVTDIQNYCIGGHFGPDGVTGCTGAVSGALLALDGIQNTDQTTILGVTQLSITDDFTLDGGTAGSATGGIFADQFTSTSTTTVTPEPGGFLLTASGLALAAIRKFRSTH